MTLREELDRSVQVTAPTASTIDARLRRIRLTYEVALIVQRARAAGAVGNVERRVVAVQRSEVTVANAIRGCIRAGNHVVVVDVTGVCRRAAGDQWNRHQHTRLAN